MKFVRSGKFLQLKDLCILVSLKYSGVLKERMVVQKWEVGGRVLFEEEGRRFTVPFLILYECVIIFMFKSKAVSRLVFNTSFP